MKNYLKELGITDSLTLELDVQQSDFAQILNEHVDRGAVIYTSFSEVFKSSKNKYVGKVYRDGFRIRKRHKFGSFENKGVVATGRFSQYNDKLTIETEISPFHELAIVGLCIVLFMLFIFASFGLLISFAIGKFWMFPLILIFLFGLFVFLPFQIAKFQTRQMKYDLEKDLNALEQKVKSNSK